MGTKLTVAFVTVVVMTVGLLVGSFIGRVILGGVAGFVIGLPLGLALITRQRRWIATALLNVWFMLSFVAGGWLGVVYALAASVLTFFVSAAIVRELYGGSAFSAFFYHFKILTGLFKGFQIISDGKSVIPNDTNTVLGPRLIIVEPGNALILQRGPRQTRISGPAIFTSELFEYVKRIYNLQKKQGSFTFEDVLTSDLMATTVEISATYGINVSDAARRGEIPLTPAEIDHIKYIDSRMPDWERATRGAIERSVRRAIATRSLADLLTNGKLLDLEQQIFQDLTSPRIHAWGIRVDEATIQNVQPERKVISERATAEALRAALLLLADGYRNAIKAGMPEEAIHREVWRHTPEQMTKDPATKMIFTPELHTTHNGLPLSSGFEQ